METNITIRIPTYDVNEGFKSKWEDNFEISIINREGEIQLTANKAGLVSLATHLLTLAQDDIPSGYHIHYDVHNSLEEGSSNFILQKK